MRGDGRVFEVKEEVVSITPRSETVIELVEGTLFLEDWVRWRVVRVREGLEERDGQRGFDGVC